MVPTSPPVQWQQTFTHVSRHHVVQSSKCLRMAAPGAPALSLKTSPPGPWW